MPRSCDPKEWGEYDILSYSEFIELEDAMYPSEESDIDDGEVDND